MPAPKPAALLLCVTFILSACSGGHSSPVAKTYHIGGSLSGLGAGNSVVLQDNSTDDLTLNGDGSFTFATAVTAGAGYAVTVSTPPSGEHCSVTNGTGTVSGADVTDITVSCSVDPPAAPTLSLNYGIKQLKFSWNAVADADYYKLFENPDGVSGYTQLGVDLSTTSYDHDIPLYRRLNATYLVEACNSAGCTDSSAVSLSANLIGAVGYIKASNTNADDYFGYALALSADGNTLAVGAIYEDSNATGINGDQSNNAASNSGAVYVFTHSSGVWSQQAYVKASNTGADDWFGYAVSLSADGNTLAVGAPNEASNATGFSGDQSNNSASDAGAVYVFIRSSGVWSQQVYVKASNTDMGDAFGSTLALAADGSTLAVGAIFEDSNATGIDGDQGNNSAGQAGAVYVFTRGKGAWSQQAYVKASNTDAVDFFGSSLALSSDGNTLAVGAYGEASSATGIDGDQSNNSASNSGAVYVFIRSGGAWSQQAYVKASNTDLYDEFGAALALAADGSTLAVGAIYEGSSATGIDGDQSNNSAGKSGAVYIFTRGSGLWSQQAYVKASNTGAVDYFGSTLALSADGNSLAVTAPGEHSNATGIDGNQSTSVASNSGAAYVFTRNSGVWSQQAYIKASNTDAYDRFGSSLGLAEDGDTLAVSALGEASSAAGIGGNQGDNSATSAGAAYLY